MAPHSAVGWVRDARANPAVTIREGRAVREARLVESIGGDPGLVAASYEREAFPRRFMGLPAERPLPTSSTRRLSLPMFRVDER